MSSLRKIGEQLRARREELQISLREAQAATKIRQRYLEALEAGEEGVLPGEAYTKGFLRSYANYLGLDGAALVEEYKRAKGASEGDGTPERTERMIRTATRFQPPAGEPPVTPSFRRRLGHGRPASTSVPSRVLRARRVQRLLAALLTVLALAVAAGIYVLYLTARTELPGDSQPPISSTTGSGGDQGAPGQPDTANRPTPPADQQAPDEPAGGVGTGDRPTIPPVEPSPPQATPVVRASSDEPNRYLVAAEAIRVEVEVTARCWVRVQADGRVIYEGTLQPGAQVAWEAAQELRVRVGYPAGLKLTAFGQPIGFEDPTRVQTLVFQRES